jgi:TatD DNase family protein
VTLIDTHSHIHDREKFPDPEATLAEARAAGVDQIIVVGVNPKDWWTATEFAIKHPRTYSICGWHPNYTADYDPIDLPKLATLLQLPEVVALGEIGLDYHWDYSPTVMQHKALRDQLRLAQEMNKPVVFHAREAYSDLLDVLEQQPRIPYLFHCFAGDKSEARRAMRLDAYFGIDGPITYKKADDLREIVRVMNPERVVLETDSPYMSPVPHRGKPNSPAYIPLINQVLAEVWGMTPEETAAQTTENARRFFNLPN